MINNEQLDKNRSLCWSYSCLPNAGEDPPSIIMDDNNSQQRITRIYNPNGFYKHLNNMFDEFQKYLAPKLLKTCISYFAAVNTIEISEHRLPLGPDGPGERI